MSVSPDVLTRQMSERELQAAVIEMARWLHWRVFHPWRSDHSAAGYADLTLVRARPGEAPRLLFIEFKTERGRLSPAQHEWLDDLRRVQDAAALLGAPLLVQVAVFRPADWYDGTIEAVLKGA
jgi:hypothetical protein